MSKIQSVQSVSYLIFGMITSGVGLHSLPVRAAIVEEISSQGFFSQSGRGQQYLQGAPQTTAIKEPLTDPARPYFCSLPEIKAEKVIPTTVRGSYWFNMVNDRYLTFMEDADFQGFDLEKGEGIKITGDIDPYPAPMKNGIDRQIYFHPNPMELFYLPDALKDQDSTKSIFQDNEHDGYYHSVATLNSVKNKSENYSVVRVLTAQGQGRIQDYRIEFGSDGRPGKVTILNPSPIPLCVNLGTDRGSLDFSTPILSPMGDEMAITDNSTGHLIIVGINPKTGDCTKKEDLGIPTGKVHFSPDGRKIGFSTQALQMKKAKYGLANIPYLWDRDARTLTDLSLGDAKSPADVPYVGFLSNGNVIYQAVSIDERGNQKRYYAILDPKKMRSITIDSNGMSQPPLRQGYEQGDYQACVPPSQDLNAKVAIGRLWNQICGFAEKLTDTEAAFLSLRLTPHFCRKILNDHSDQLALAAQGSETTQTKDFMSSATRDQLKAACPTTELAKGKVSVKEVGAAAGKMPTVFGSRCMGCHTPQSPHGHIPWDRPEEVRKMMAYQYDKEGNLLKDAAGKPVRSQTKTLIQALSEGMREDHQPRIPPYGPSLTTQERKDILEWAKTGTSTSSGQ